MSDGTLQRIDRDIIDTVRALFPDATLTVGRDSKSHPAFRFVPGVRRTHMLVPADHPRAAAGAVNRPSAKDSRRQKIQRDAVGFALGVPLLSALAMPHTLKVVPARDSLLDYLSAAVGREVRFSIAIGSRRANRKPVLTVYATDGTEIGFAKVGLTPLANALIDHEAGVLEMLSRTGTTEFTSPESIHHGRWGDSSVLLMESLRPHKPGRQRGLPLSAIAELSQVEGLARESIAGSAWLDRITAAGSDLADKGAPTLARVGNLYREDVGDVISPFGRWHGDLGPWNMVWDGDTACIWDWERSEPSVPVAIDAVHFTCHTALRDIGNLSRAREVLAGPGTTAVRATLDRCGADTSNARLVRACLLGYLLSIGARFATDAERVDGDVVKPLATWYLTVLADQLGR